MSAGKIAAQFVISFFSAQYNLSESAIGAGESISVVANETHSQKIPVMRR